MSELIFASKLATTSVRLDTDINTVVNESISPINTKLLTAVRYLLSTVNWIIICVITGDIYTVSQ